MNEYSAYAIEGTVLSEEAECGLHELCRLCGVNDRLIQEMIEEGIIQPRGVNPSEWRFTLLTVHRVQTVIRLQQDLRVNLPGCALVLDLLEELEELRCLAGRLGR